MAGENIIAVNAPNTISIMIMAGLGGFILMMIHKFAKSKIAPGNNDQAA